MVVASRIATLHLAIPRAKTVKPVCAGLLKNLKMSAQYSFHLILAPLCPLVTDACVCTEARRGFVNINTARRDVGGRWLALATAGDGVVCGIGGGGRERWWVEGSRGKGKWERGRQAVRGKGVKIHRLSMPTSAVDSNFNCQDKTQEIKSQHALGTQRRLYVSHEDMKDRIPNTCQCRSLPRLVCTVRLPVPTATPVLSATGAL